MKILLVEDDALISEPLTKALIDQHYSVETVTDGRVGLERLESFTYDLILLDVMLPNLDGISLCRQLRSQGNQTPIVLLTAQDTSTNKVMGLDAGADDYVAKPFDLQELLARIRALLRRGGAALPPLLVWHNLTLDPSVCEVTCHDQLLRLTPKEYGLLELFLRNPHRIFSTSVLIDHLWSFEESPTEDTIRSHIKALRQKLKSARVLADPIETVYGIGYRLKPTQAVSKRTKTAKPVDGQESKQAADSQHPPTSSSTNAASQSPPGMASIWQQVKESIDRRVAILEHAIQLLLQNQLSEEVRHQAEWEAHKLAGSLGMFESDEGSRLAQAIEPLFELGLVLTPQQVQQLSQLVVALRQEVQRMNSPQPPEPPATGASGDGHWLLIVGSDATLAEQLATEATHWGMRSRVISNPVAAREQISEQRPDAVLLDFATTDSMQNHLTLLAELGACTPPVPTVVLATQTSLIDRVRATRLAGCRILQQPTPATHVLEAVHQLLQQTHPTEAMILVVDDDSQVLTALQRLLLPWGFYVSVLDNPLLFLETLEATLPDLLILDVEMPHISGIDLCQVVRNDPRWSGLPILFLTAHTDAETMHQVFAAGADDYVCKPIVGPELLTRILNRLERSRLLRTLSETDALTGIANRRKSMQTLTEFLLWSRHCQQPICFAILKLNGLKDINQHYGHAAGDEVLSRFGELLRHTFHREDVVSRWAGTEFVVGMAGMSKAEGTKRLFTLLEKLHQYTFRAANGARFQATFGAGVVQYPQDGTDLHALYQAADTLLANGTGGIST
ncbi:response regulator [Oculatella sp. LEGE 06141]|uniref:response regulator n=1 Tax=Oculatella sp. LEGE 06141 TaxID=1828648 RepID=UPI0018821EA7|nr:response regulator [Oculatella sp. LEGE 06141]MBE9178791.1 response regulator [Oculatella sp. LEGE 06141]